MKALRYQYVIDEVRRLKARTVIEVGTWNGDRAIEIASVTSWPFVYHGFDLFEEMTDEISKAEYNVKRKYLEGEVREKLEQWRRVSGREDVMFILHKGNTKETLPRFLEEVGEGTVDMAWVDGGHSEETIRSDGETCLKLVKRKGTILFDDWYYPPQSGLGCNRFVQELAQSNSGFEATVLPYKDRVNDFEGKQVGTVQVVRVTEALQN